MSDLPFPSVTRRNFVIASCGLLIPRIGWAGVPPRPVLHWPLDRIASPGRESVTKSEATIVDGAGRLAWVEDGETQLPRLDGYSVWIQHLLDNPVQFDREFGLSAWLALESFPVTTASVIEWGQELSGISLAIDRLGFALISVRQEGSSAECRSERPIERGRWVHLASTLSLDGTLLLFVDGKECSRSKIDGGAPKLEAVGTVYMGRAMQNRVVAKVFPTDVLNGLMREVRVYRSSLTLSDVQTLSREFHSQSAPLITNPAWFANDVQHPRYHAMPPRAWTNEPHGLVRWRGQYHLFYQKNANGPYWGHIHWGHMTSPDLLRWTEQPMALIPEPGPDSEGCWSGSAIVANGKIVIVYTGGDGKRASICMASSEDGVHFAKHPGNPVIEAPPSTIGVKEFRDPFIWKEGTEYRMIIGSGIAGVGGTALLYRSHDLTSWSYVKPLLIGDKANSGVFWEMPVFIKIDDRHVLIVCEVPGRASYWVGTWENDKFTALSSTPQRLDLFNHFLSPTPYIDENGKAITIGIAPETRASIETWQAGWAHLYGLPRELTLDKSGRLQQRPIAELSTRFTPLLSMRQKQPLQQTWTVFESTGTCANISARIERNVSDSVVIALRRSPDRQEETLLRYEWRNAQLTLDRSKSSINTHTVRNVQQVAYVPRTQGTIELDIFIDRSVLDVFVDGQACFTSRIYPALPESVGIAACSEGGEACLTHLGINIFNESGSAAT
jgi:beta-fructofuranosidase